MQESENSFPKRLETALRHARATKASLSRSTGIAQSTISRWFGERPSTPNFNTIAQVAEALGVRATWLASGEGAMSGIAYEIDESASPTVVRDRADSAFLASTKDESLVEVYQRLLRKIPEDTLVEAVEGEFDAAEAEGRKPAQWCLDGLAELRRRVAEAKA